MKFPLSLLHLQKILSNYRKVHLNVFLFSEVTDIVHTKIKILLYLTLSHVLPNLFLVWNTNEDIFVNTMNVSWAQSLYPKEKKSYRFERTWFLEELWQLITEYNGFCWANQILKQIPAFFWPHTMPQCRNCV